MEVQEIFNENEVVGDYRILYYPASRRLTPAETLQITQRVFDFLAGWKAHGTPLQASFKILFHQIIIIAVDEEEASASGCSIDALNAMMQDLDQRFMLGLFDRMKVLYFIENPEAEDQEIVCENRLNMKAKIQSRSIPISAKILDFSGSTYSEFLSKFALPVPQSWAAQWL